MSILGRLIMRNILGKPLRSLAIIVALAASAFAMLFCVEGRKAPEENIRKMMLNAYGGSEILIIDPVNRDLSIDLKDFPEGTKLLFPINKDASLKSSKGEYAVKLRYCDPEGLRDFQLSATLLEPKDGLLISAETAEKCGIKEGDTVGITCGDKVSKVKITGITDDRYVRRTSMLMFAGKEVFKELTGQTEIKYPMAYVDIPNELDVKETAKSLEKKFAGKNYRVAPIMTDEMVEEMGNQTTVFYLIFAVILLMTLFLTVSMSRHIANERIAVIGTLRSLGGSLPKTSVVLMTESAAYGIVGGAVGAVGYALVGKFAVSALFGTSNMEYKMPIFWYPLAVVFAIVVQLACQSGALIKAVKTPVRDIIFSSRDTAYHLSVKKIVIGAVVLAAGAAVGIISEDIIQSIGAITLICIGSVMVLPIVLKGISFVFVRLFGALGLPCAKLAANEVQYKKSTVASTQLTYVALAITAAIFIVVQSISRLYQAEIYNFDARVDTDKVEQDNEYITKMSEVTDYEYIYSYYCPASLNGTKKHQICIAPYGEYKLFTSIKELGSTPPKAGEAYLGKSVASKLGVGIGDTVTVENFDMVSEDENGEYVNDIYRFKVIGICDTLDHFSETIVVNKDWFIENLSKYPYYLVLKLSKPGDIETVREEIEKHDINASIRSVETLKAEEAEDEASIMTILNSITAIGCILALLGAVSNAVIGFEQSKRKYAVLHSVAASKKKLSKLILLETLFSALTSGVLALLMGNLLSSLLNTALNNLGMGIDVVYNVPRTAAFIGVLTAALLLSAVKPILSLRKMNTAAELKYE